MGWGCGSVRWNGSGASGDSTAFRLQQLPGRVSEDRTWVNLDQELLDGGLQPQVWAFEDHELIGATGASQCSDSGDVVKESQDVLLLLVTGDPNDLHVPR